MKRLKANSAKSRSGGGSNFAAEILAKIDGLEGERKAWSRFLRHKRPAVRREARKFLKRLALLREPPKSKSSKQATAQHRLAGPIKKWNRLASRTLGLRIGALTIQGCEITVQLIPASSPRPHLIEQYADDRRVTSELFDLCRRAALFAASVSGVHSFQLRISGAVIPPDLFEACAPITLPAADESR
jgi:hypothetical protein